MEPWFRDLIRMLSADSTAALLAGSAPLIASNLKVESAALFVVSGGTIAAEACHSANQIVLESLRRRALEASAGPLPEPVSMESGLAIAIEPVTGDTRLVFCARWAPGAATRSLAETCLVDALRLVAGAAARLEIAGRAAIEHERRERWFRTLDQQLRVLDRERQKFSAVVGQSDLYVFVTDQERVVRWTNKAFAQAFPPLDDRSNWLGARCRDVCLRLGLGNGIGECAHCPIGRAFRSNQPAHQDFRTPVGGVSHHLYLTALPIRGPDGAPHEVMAMIQDLSDLRALRRSEARYRLLFERSTTAILMVEPATHRIVLANPTSTSVFGYNNDELLGLTLARLHSPAEWLRVEARYALAYADQRPEPFECMLICRGGAERMAVVQASRFDLEGQDVVMLQLLDITARKRAEETLGRRERELRKAQKLEMAGRLASGMAYEFIQLLSVIRGRAEILSEQLAGDESRQRHLEEIRGATERGAWLTRQLEAFGPQDAAPRPIDLAATVGGLEFTLRTLAGDQVALTFHGGEEAAWIDAEAVQVEQILVNLVMSARQSMPAGGHVTIAIAPAAGSSTMGATRAGASESSAVLTVSDTGGGMDDETRQRLLEPDFQMRDGDGTGFGIRMVHGIVSRCGGSLRVESRRGEGTTIHVLFRSAEPVRAASARPRRGVREPAIVLLVDDDDAVRAVACEVLKMEGYSVLEARNGTEALEIATRLEGGLDLLLTDVVMPRMSGGELARRMSQLDPGLKVLFLSAYADDAIVRRGVVEAGMPFLQKPFTLESLADKVRSVLNRSPDTDDLEGRMAPSGG